VRGLAQGDHTIERSRPSNQGLMASMKRTGASSWGVCPVSSICISTQSGRREHIHSTAVGTRCGLRAWTKRRRGDVSDHGDELTYSRNIAIVRAVLALRPPPKAGGSTVVFD
jgi:hypothetical protein